MKRESLDFLTPPTYNIPLIKPQELAYFSNNMPHIKHLTFHAYTNKNFLTFLVKLSQLVNKHTIVNNAFINRKNGYTTDPTGSFL